MIGPTTGAIWLHHIEILKIKYEDMLSYDPACSSTWNRKQQDVAWLICIKQPASLRPGLAMRMKIALGKMLLLDWYSVLPAFCFLRSNINEDPADSSR